MSNVRGRIHVEYRRCDEIIGARTPVPHAFQPRTENLQRHLRAHKHFVDLKESRLMSKCRMIIN